MTDDSKEKMRTICTGKSKENFVDWTFKKPDKSGARYGLAAFTRYPDGNFVDCFHVLFKMDFMIAPKEKGYLWKRWRKNDAPETENPFDLINDDDFQNFFRLKTLEECYKEGYIEKINYVKPEEVGENSTLPEDTSEEVGEKTTLTEDTLKQGLESGPESPKKMRTEQLDG